MGEMGKDRKRKLSSYLQLHRPQPHNISSPTPTSPTPYPAHQFPILFLPGVGKAEFDDEGNRRKRRLWQGRKLNVSVSVFEAVGKLFHLFLGYLWVGGTLSRWVGCWKVGGWGCVGSLEGGAEAGCWDGAPMLSPIPYLSDNLHIFISEPTIIFLAPTKTHQTPQKTKNKKGEWCNTYCDWKKLVLLRWHWHGPPLLPVLYSAAAARPRTFFNTNAMILFLSYIYYWTWPWNILL